MSDNTLLIGDIGGTNARFAMANADVTGFALKRTLKCADFDTAGDAITQYLGTVDVPRPDAICLAAAGPIVDQQVRFTNNTWQIRAQDLKQAFGTDHVVLLNDFEAIAFSIPLLGADDAVPIGLPDPKPQLGDTYTIAVIGPGTGLGAVGLKKFGEHRVPIAGEASHGGFAPENQVQIDILMQLRERFDRVSSERLVSGPGLKNLYWALCRVHGEDRRALSAAEIFAAANDDRNSRASEAVEIFFEILGQVAGDLALALYALDGVYIAGGIAKRYPEKLANSRFRSGFEHKGRYRSLMERIPTQLITHDEPGLLGAAYRAQQLVTAR